jgi:hypothetical protein
MRPFTESLEAKGIDQPEGLPTPFQCAVAASRKGDVYIPHALTPYTGWNYNL